MFHQLYSFKIGLIFLPPLATCVSLTHSKYFRSLNMFNCEKFNKTYAIEESEADEMHPLFICMCVCVCVRCIYVCACVRVCARMPYISHAGKSEDTL